MDLCFQPVKELSRLITTKEVSASEVVEAHLKQIERVNPVVNAVVTLTAETALEEAKAADGLVARGGVVPPLHGIPVIHKDLFDTKDVRTTYGSPIYADHIPDRNALIVDRLKKAGAISLGKSNTPEFGAGSQTFNQVFGRTLNPYDLSRTCGGSSGGAAVSLAAGMTALADGSDMGGSLRNPANFCNVVGLRTAAGRVPTRGGSRQNLSVQGPMGRTVEDVALMLSVIAGPDPSSPIALETSGEIFDQPLDRNFTGTKIAWSDDLGGLPIDAEIKQMVRNGLSIFEDLGCELTETSPDFTGADEAFKAFRAWSFGHRADQLEQHRAQMKDTVIWNIEQGINQSGQDLARADVLRSELYNRVSSFFGEYEYLICPVSQVPPFSIDIEWITEIEGQAMETYIDWMKSCYFISITGLPAISVPGGFTENGLPMGLQIVGRPRSEFSLLQMAFAFEALTGFHKIRPEVVGNSAD